MAGQVYGCFFITFAVGAALAAIESERRAVTAFIASSLLLTLLVLVVSGVHIDRFKPEPVTWLWFAAFAAATVAFAYALATARTSPARRTSRKSPRHEACRSRQSAPTAMPERRVASP